jgi:mutator protein MutT
MNPDFLSIALAIICHPSENRYLIAQRKLDSHLGGLWEFPGGKCLPGETPAGCAVREAREETGLTVFVQESWPAVSFAYPDRALVLHPFLCRTESAEARPLESLQIIWVSPDELDYYKFPSANILLLERLRMISKQ